MRSQKMAPMGLIMAVMALGPVTAALAIPFSLDLTVAGGPSAGINGTPGSFSGGFDLPGFTGSGNETFTGAAQIQNFSLTLDNVWDDGQGIILPTPSTHRQAPSASHSLTAC